MAVWMGHRTETAHMQGPMEVQTKRNTLDAALDGLLCLVRSVDVDVSVAVYLRLSRAP